MAVKGSQKEEHNFANCPLTQIEQVRGPFRWSKKKRETYHAIIIFASRHAAWAHDDATSPDVAAVGVPSDLPGSARVRLRKERTANLMAAAFRCYLG